MTDQRIIGDIFERNIQTLTRAPSRGFLTCSTKARLVDGLRCEISDGSWTFGADLPVKIGGSDAAPNPGMLGRGALASCLVIGVARWAARLDVPIESLEVEVEADFDARGELGMSRAIYPGYHEIRYRVSIQSPASEREIAELLELAERYSPYLDNFGRPVALRRIHRVNGG